MNTYLLICIVIFSVIITGYVYFKNSKIRKTNKNTDEHNNWYLLFFYYNPEDPRTFVPKKLGIGVTFNFARPFPKLFVIALIVLFVLHEFSLL